MDINTLMHEGLTSYAAGNIEQAIEKWQHILNIEPGHMQALRYLENIGVSVEQSQANSSPTPSILPPVQSPQIKSSKDKFAQAHEHEDPWSLGEQDTAIIRIKRDEPLIDMKHHMPSKNYTHKAQADADEPKQEQELQHLLQGAHELYELNDFTQALELYQKVLAKDPENTEAAEKIGQCRTTLISMLESKIGDLQSVPKVLLPPEDIIWLNIDHRAGFLLARIDGISSFEDIVELSGMDTLDTYRILVQLLENKAIGL